MICSEGQYRCIVNGESFKVVMGQAVLIEVTTKEWETEFFNRRFGQIRFNGDLLASSIAGPGPSQGLWDSIRRHLDTSEFVITELHLDVSHFCLIPCFEDIGFRLVDSKVSFVTRIDVSEQEPPLPPYGCLRDARDEDAASVIELAHSSLSRNSGFVSRFRNPDYFAAEETERYYAAWVGNNLTGQGCHAAVWESGGQVIGFFIYRLFGERSRLPIYKAILAAVHPEHRGHGAHLFLQAFLYRRMASRSFFVDNTTQLTNFVVLRNHLLSKKSLDSIALVFYRKRSEPGSAVYQALEGHSP